MNYIGSSSFFVLLDIIRLLTTGERERESSFFRPARHNKTIDYGRERERERERESIANGQVENMRWF